MIDCCDFCRTQIECDAHWCDMGFRYGKTRSGDPIVPPAGWAIVPFRAAIPQHHREFIQGHDLPGKWAGERHCHSTMTPLSAHPAGYVLAFATPKP